MKNGDAHHKERSLLKEARSLVIFTGTGLTSPFDCTISLADFQRSPERVWALYNARRKAADAAIPPPSAIALARLETLKLRARKMKPLATNGHGNGHGHLPPTPPMRILTQNTEGLHQQAGSLEVIELRGSLWRLRCTGCELLSGDFPIVVPAPPRCDACGELLRPDVVWRGEPIDKKVLEEALKAVESCDVFCVIGEPVVEPAFQEFSRVVARKNLVLLEIKSEKDVAGLV